MNLHRIKAGLAAFIDAYLGRRLAYFGLYPATVVGQSADGRVEVLPDDDEVRGTGIGLVELRNGAPGYKFEIPAGARCLVGFAAADPSRPYHASWEPETAVNLITFDGGSSSVARVDDSTDVGTLQIVGTQTTQTVIVTYIPPGGIPLIYPIVGGLTVIADFNVGPIPLAGIITTGNDKLKA